MTLSDPERIWLAVLPKVSSVFSFFGSLWIIIEVATEKSKRKVPYNRLLLAMSVYDVLESIFNFGSTWMIPRGSPNIIWAFGNTATCTAQGFFLTLSSAVPLYNAMLSIYYVLVINYNYSDKKLRSFVEPAMHLFCFVWAFGTALYSSLAGLMNNANLWCWIAPLPQGCLNSWEYGTAEEGNRNPCIRGDNIWIYRFGFYFIPLWISIAISTVSTLWVYKYVHRLDKATLRYRLPERKSVWLAMENKSNGTKKRASSIAVNSLQAHSTDDSNHCDDDLNEEKVSDCDNYSNIFEQGEPTGAWTTSMSNNLEREPRDADSADIAAAMEAEPKRAHQNAVIRRYQIWKSKRQKYAQEMTHTMEVFHQACFYLGAFYCTHIWSTSNRVCETITGGSVFGLLAMHAFFDPFQGFLNLLVYLRPRYVRMQKRYPELSRRKILIFILRFSFMGETIV